MVLPNGINHRRDFAVKKPMWHRVSTSLREFFIFRGIVVGCLWNKRNQFLDELNIRHLFALHLLSFEIPKKHFFFTCSIINLTTPNFWSKKVLRSRFFAMKFKIFVTQMFSVYFLKGFVNTRQHNHSCRN